MSQTDLVSSIVLATLLSLVGCGEIKTDPEFPAGPQTSEGVWTIQQGREQIVLQNELGIFISHHLIVSGDDLIQMTFMDFQEEGVSECTILSRRREGDQYVYDSTLKKTSDGKTETIDFEYQESVKLTAKGDLLFMQLADQEELEKSTAFIRVVNGEQVPDLCLP